VKKCSSATLTEADFVFRKTITGTKDTDRLQKIEFNFLSIRGGCLQVPISKKKFSATFFKTLGSMSGLKPKFEIASYPIQMKTQIKTTENRRN
jgi:hypothetical protein